MYIISGSKAMREKREAERGSSGKEKYTTGESRNERCHEITDVACRYPPWRASCTAFREFSHPAHCAKRHTVARRANFRRPLNYLRKSRHEFPIDYFARGTLTALCSGDINRNLFGKSVITKSNTINLSSYYVETL